MEKVHIGYVQGVHGLRGDLKIRSNFEFADKVLTNGNVLLLNDEEHTITNCKFYKGFYLTTIDNLKDINLVEKYIGFDVYYDRAKLNLKEGEYLIEDLIGLEIVCAGKVWGKVTDVYNNSIYKILEVNNNRRWLIPVVDEYVIKLDFDNKKVECKNIEGLIK